MSDFASTVRVDFKSKARLHSHHHLLLSLSFSLSHSSALALIPELNSWLQIADMQWNFQFTLTFVMALDFVGCYLIENILKFLFLDTKPGPIVLKGQDRRDERRKNRMDNLNYIVDEIKKKT